MRKRKALLIVVGLVAALVVLAGCAQSASTYTDPFAYCAAVGTLAQLDARYTGDKVPDAIIKAMLAKKIITADMPADVQKSGASWRCAAGKVVACHVGANIPCGEKANTSKDPSAAMNDYCQKNQTADVIPANVAGRATVYEWKCKAGKPEAGKQIYTADAQGYIAEVWQELAK